MSYSRPQGALNLMQVISFTCVERQQTQLFRYRGNIDNSDVQQMQPQQYNKP
jgi:hypothetical protein